MSMLCVCYVLPRPLRGVVSAIWQLRSGAVALALDQVWASRAQDSQAGSAAVAEEGRAQRHCGQEAARITLGVLEVGWAGGLTPTRVKEEGRVCGDVRRRKNLVKPDKASEKQCEDCPRKKGRRRERLTFQQGNAHWWILWHFASDNCLLVHFKHSSTSWEAANFLFSGQVRC